jgi:hypothetical protein
VFSSVTTKKNIILLLLRSKYIQVKFIAAGGTPQKDWVSGPLIGGSQNLEERPITIVDHHPRTSQRTYLEPPVLSCYSPVFLKSKLQACLI